MEIGPHLNKKTVLHGLQLMQNYWPITIRNCLYMENDILIDLPVLISKCLQVTMRDKTLNPNPYLMLVVIHLIFNHMPVHEGELLREISHYHVCKHCYLLLDALFVSQYQQLSSTCIKSDCILSQNSNSSRPCVLYGTVSTCT